MTHIPVYGFGIRCGQNRPVEGLRDDHDNSPEVCDRGLQLSGCTRQQILFDSV